MSGAESRTPDAGNEIRRAPGNDPRSPAEERPWMIYGANGYTGELIARAAAERGLSPVLAGRSREPVEKLAGELGLPSRIFSLEGGSEGGGSARERRSAAETTARQLEGVSAVLHCAGPFVHTSRPMVEACLAARCHYLDITGEIAVFEGVLGRDGDARRAGVALLPGVGFDVVPTDCLAARLAEALPEATHLDLAFVGEGAEWSRGTLKTMVESLPFAGAVRREGRIVPVEAAHATREVELPELGRRTLVTIPWGDVSTAYHSTGIPDVRTFTGMPPKAVKWLKRTRPLLPVLGLKPLKRLIQKWIERKVTGPDEETRRRGRIHVWGEARDGAGRRATSTLVTPEGYSFTVEASLASVQRLLAGEVGPGAWTPSRAFGTYFVDGLPGVESREVELHG